MLPHLINKAKKKFNISGAGLLFRLVGPEKNWYKTGMASAFNLSFPVFS